MRVTVQVIELSSKNDLKLLLAYLRVFPIQVILWLSWSCLHVIGMLFMYFCIASKSQFKVSSVFAMLFCDFLLGVMVYEFNFFGQVNSQ